MGHEGADSLPGDFAYLQTRRIAWDSVIYDLDDAEVWTLLQLRQGCPLQPFNCSNPVQVAAANPENLEAATVAFVPVPTAAAAAELRRLAEIGPVVAFSPVPGQLRDLLLLPAVAIEQVPSLLLSEFPRLIAGL